MHQQLAAPDIAVFHDESGDFGHGEWVFTGLLWVRREDVSALAGDLQAQRGEHAGEIHFYRFPRNFGGSYGAAARTARAWFELWLADWSHRTWFNALAVNRRHLMYDHTRFGRRELAYNHFTALAVTTGLAAHFKEHELVRLAVYSDERTGRADDAPADVAGRDAFARGLRDALADTTAEGHAGPRVAPPEVPAHSLSCWSGGPFAAEQELLQLTDLLLGAVSTAVAPQSRAATKLWFAREIARVMEDVRQPPHARSLGLRGRFVVSYFPDYAGRLYHDGPIHLWDM
jgi:hypothetical protein